MTNKSKPAERESTLPEAVAEYVPGLDQGLGYLLEAPAHVRRMADPVFRIRHFIQFRLERLLLRGAVARLLVIAGIVALVAVGGGLLAFYLTGAFEDPFASTWWAFLRITDPGYLGDDEGTWLRVISVVMTIGGLVLVIGALIAIMTQWLNHTIEQLEQGLTPIVMKNHVLILGWSSRTAAIVEQLLSSEGRIRHFLDTFGGRRLRIVILAESIGPVLVQELKDRLGPLWRSNQVILRSGSALRLEHLERVDYRHAAAVVLPAEKFGNNGGGDETVIKTLTTAGTAPPGPLPLFVAEIIEPDHVRAGNRAYRGPSEIIASGRLTSRVLLQTARYPGLSYIIEDLFDYEGVQVFLVPGQALAGTEFSRLPAGFEQAIPLGIVRGSPGAFVPLLKAGERVADDDLIAVIAYSAAQGQPRVPVDSVGANEDKEGEKEGALPLAPTRRAGRRMLIVGWSNTVPSLLAECDGYADEFDEVNVVSLHPASAREAVMVRKGISVERVQHRQIDADITARADVERLRPHEYDVIVIVASDWLGSAEMADARSLLGYLMINEVLESGAARPHLIVEAMVEASASLFTAPGVELLVTPKLQSHLFAQVALRRDLNSVFEHLLGVGGAEISLRTAGGLTDCKDFGAVQRRFTAVDEVALGVQRSDGVHELNPDHDKSITLRPEDRIIVLTMTDG